MQKREGGGGGRLFRELGVRASYREDVSYACVRGTKAGKICAKLKVQLFTCAAKVFVDMGIRKEKASKQLFNFLGRMSK